MSPILLDMKTKPWFLVVLALLHVLAPLGNLILNAIVMKKTLAEQWYYWFNVVPKFLLVLYLLVPVLAGIFIFICKRWSYWAYLGCIFLLFVSNLYSYWTSMSGLTLLVLVGIVLIDILVVAYFVVPSVQQIYFDPRMRWWEAAPRYHFDIEGRLQGSKALIQSLSQGGLLLVSDLALEENTSVNISWNYQGQETAVKGVVIYRIKKAEGFGYGVRFEHTSQTQTSVKEVIRSLHEQNRVVAERLPGPEDSFFVWLRKVVSTGEGIFPKKKA